MIKLDKDFNPEMIDEEIEYEFHPAINYTRINSTNGSLVFTKTRMYVFYDPQIRLLYPPRYYEISEIDKCEKFGLFGAGLLIYMKDGDKLRLSNVGKKMREGIEEAIAAGRK
ncbi:MAG: hypothetical protein IJM35_09495 [Bacteroidales bacterium]|jgi:hypothetical protein|nr:hypothetical protein [Bacteroidales bacterium]